MRISQCTIIWKRLDTFWLHSDCPMPFKLLVYDAVVKAKLLYGLESLQYTKNEDVGCFPAERIKKDS
eukprot:10846629-Prorocentrum_lima.AAC.1